MPGLAETVMTRWDRAKGTAMGRWLFSRAVGRFAPYTGTIGARVEGIEPGRARVAMRDRKAVRNHLRSIHAVALTNLLELTGGLAVIAALPAGARMIPLRIEIEFIKKARGTVAAESRCDIPSSVDHGELPSAVTIRDGGGDEVARGRVVVMVGAES
ncbi:MAG: hotdog fold domain-containing protein [Holophagae bacterium]